MCEEHGIKKAIPTEKNPERTRFSLDHDKPRFRRACQPHRLVMWNLRIERFGDICCLVYLQFVFSYCCHLDNSFWEYVWPYSVSFGVIFPSSSSILVYFNVWLFILIKYRHIICAYISISEFYFFNPVIEKNSLFFDNIWQNDYLYMIREACDILIWSSLYIKRREGEKLDRGE